MNAMTLEQVRDWHRHQLNFLPESGVPTDLHQNAADAIDAHLAQPAQAVDVGAIQWVIDYLEDEGNTCMATGDGLDAQWGSRILSMSRKLTRALSGEKAGPVGTPGQVSVPIKLPLLKVPEIKDWLADDLQVYDCPARAVWAGLLAIVTGISVDEQIAMLGAASPSPDKEAQP